jgi:cell wall-associated NlpC family hydrolase
MSDWRTDLLKALGSPATPQNLQFLGTWQRWEGGHTNNDAKFNWLNTTHGPGRSINSVGVKAFPSYHQGIQSTVETLLNGRYDDIIDGLKRGDPSGASAGLQTWVSGRPDGNPAYARRVLGDSAPAAPPAVRGTAAVQRTKARLSQVPPRPGKPTSPNPEWDAAMRMIFDDDPEMAALMAQSDDKIARATGLVSPGGSLRPVDDAPDVKGAKGVGFQVAKVAASQLGKPYVFGSGPSTDSFDCSDLIQWAYKQIGVNLPRVTYDQIKVGRSVKGKPLQPGDLVFPHEGHVVMYVGGGKVIAAPYTGTVVQYQDVPRSVLDVRRVL